MQQTKTAAKPLVLKAPGDERHFFSVPAEVSDLSDTFNGNILAENGAECEIKRNIIHLINKKPENLTLAQLSNVLSLTAKVYEDTWRKRSIGIISGETFPLEDERKLLQTWVAPKPNELIVDVGCSTAFYARSVLNKEPGARVVALDFSEEMLQEARTYCKKENVHAFLLRADAAYMPFYAESVDAIVCGGSLNEFADPSRVLYELRRVLKKDGRCFMMHLLQANTWYGRLLQGGSKTGGLHFWTEQESDDLFKKSGFTVERRHTLGVVCFSLLRCA